MRRARRSFDLGLGRAGSAISNVVGNRVVEQHRILRHDADRTPQAGLGHLADVLAIDGDATGVDVVEAEQQPRQGALACPARADDRHLLARRNFETQLLQDRPGFVISETDIFEADGCALHQQFGGTRQIGDFALALEQAEHLVEVGQALLDLAVNDAQEIQRDIELDHEGVDHHQIAQAHGARDHAGGGPPQHQHQGAGDDQLLAGIEQRQRRLRFELHAAQFFEALVVTVGLEILVVEIFDRLVIQQRVDRLAVCDRIEFVELLAELGAPLGHGKGEGDVERQGGQGDPGEPGVELVGQQAQHQRHLDQRRHDAVERVRDQRLHGAGAALDVAGHAAGLALEVETQAQIMQVPKHLQRDRAGGALGRLGESQLAQFGEQRGREAQRAIGHQQPQRHHQQARRRPRLDRQIVDQRFQQQRYADIAQLGAEHESQRERDPPAVTPQVGQQLGYGRPIGARFCRPGLGGCGMRVAGVHGTFS